MSVAFEWFSTAITIAGVIMTSANMFPANLYISLFGNFLWLILGYMWKKWSLVTIQALIVVVYLIGIVNNLLYN